MRRSERRRGQSKSVMNRKESLPAAVIDGDRILGKPSGIPWGKSIGGRPGIFLKKYVRKILVGQSYRVKG